MSKANPQKAMAALLPLEIKVPGYDFTVRPVTLGMYAALERIGSPLITGRDPEDTLELIPSLYLLTHDPREVLTGNLVDDALAWADTVGVDAVAAIRKAAARQLNAALDIVPEDDDDAPKKKTDGWIANLFRHAAETYGWSYEEILWRVPFSALVLLWRQDGIKADKIFPLQVIEKIDNGH